MTAGSLISYAAESEFDMSHQGFIYHFYDIATQTDGAWTFKSANNDATGNLPIVTTGNLTIPARSLFRFASIDYVTDKTPFQKFYTYRLVYSIENTVGLNNWIQASIKVMDYKNTAKYRNDPLNYAEAYDIFKVYDTSTVFVKANTNEAGEQYIELEIIFNVEDEYSYNTISPMFLYSNSSTSDLNVFASLMVFESYYDYNQSGYNNAVLESQNEINNNIVNGFEATNGKLDNIQSSIDNLLENEKNEAQSGADESQDEAQNAIDNLFPFDDSKNNAQNALQMLYNSIAHTNTVTEFPFPEGKITLMGNTYKFWSASKVDLSTFLNNSFIQVLIIVSKMFFAYQAIMLTVKLPIRIYNKITENRKTADE